MNAYFLIPYIFDISGHEAPEHCDGLRVLYQELESDSLHCCLLKLHQLCDGVLNQKKICGYFGEIKCKPQNFALFLSHYKIIW